MTMVWCQNSFSMGKFIKINLLSPVRGEASPEGERKPCQGWFREESVSKTDFMNIQTECFCVSWRFPSISVWKWYSFRSFYVINDIRIEISVLKLTNQCVWGEVSDYGFIKHWVKMVMNSGAKLKWRIGGSWSLSPWSYIQIAYSKYMSMTESFTSIPLAD